MVAAPSSYSIANKSMVVRSLRRKIEALCLSDALVWGDYRLVYIEPLHYYENRRHIWYVLLGQGQAIGKLRAWADALWDVHWYLAYTLYDYGFDDTACIQIQGARVSAFARFLRVPTLAEDCLMQSHYSEGMKRWYVRDVPRCRICNRVYLIQHKRRKVGVCASCAKEAPVYGHEVTHG
jgi:hypothetical protein